MPHQPENIIAVTRTRQTTLPTHTRKHLNTVKNPKLAAVLTPDGSLKPKPSKYLTLESLAGSMGSLPDPLKGLSWHEIMEIAHEDLAQQFIGKLKP